MSRRVRLNARSTFLIDIACGRMLHISTNGVGANEDGPAGDSVDKGRGERERWCRACETACWTWVTLALSRAPAGATQVLARRFGTPCVDTGAWVAGGVGSGVTAFRVVGRPWRKECCQGWRVSLQWQPYRRDLEHARACSAKIPVLEGVRQGSVLVLGLELGRRESAPQQSLHPMTPCLGVRRYCPDPRTGRIRVAMKVEMCCARAYCRAGK